MHQHLGGRPIGSTKEAKMELTNRLRQCLNACASKFNEAKNVAKKNGKYLKEGCPNEIIKKQSAVFNLSASTKIDKEAICSCYYQRQPCSNINGTNFSNDSCGI